MKIIPLKDKILVALLPVERASATLDVIQDPGDTRWATVLELGPEAFKVSKGDEVLIRESFGHAIGEDRLVIPEDAVVAFR